MVPPPDDTNLDQFSTHCSVCGKEYEWNHHLDLSTCPDQCSIPDNPELRARLMEEMAKWREWPPKKDRNG